jgi:iron(III) transport system permease protein
VTRLKRSPLKKKIAILQNWFNSQNLILGGCALLVLYLSGVPLAMLLFGSFRNAPIGEPGAEFTLQNYAKAYLDADVYWLFWNSLRFAVGTSLVSFTIGTYLAWLSERTNTPFKKIFIVMALIPFLIPGILETIAWIFLLSPRIGLINVTLMKLFGFESAPFNIYSIWGMIWVEGLSFYPIVFLLSPQHSDPWIPAWKRLPWSRVQVPGPRCVELPSQ